MIVPILPSAITMILCLEHCRRQTDRRQMDRQTYGQRQTDDICRNSYVSKGVCVRDRDRETETEAETERHRERQTDRQTDRDRWTETDRRYMPQQLCASARRRRWGGGGEGETETHRERQTDRDRDRQTGQIFNNC